MTDEDKQAIEEVREDIWEAVEKLFDFYEVDQFTRIHYQVVVSNITSKLYKISHKKD